MHSENKTLLGILTSETVDRNRPTNPKDYSNVIFLLGSLYKQTD